MTKKKNSKAHRKPAARRTSPRMPRKADFDDGNYETSPSGFIYWRNN